MNERTIKIGDNEYTLSGLVFSQPFAILIMITLIVVLVASMKYIFN